MSSWRREFFSIYISFSHIGSFSRMARRLFRGWRNHVSLCNAQNMSLSATHKTCLSLQRTKHVSFCNASCLFLQRTKHESSILEQDSCICFPLLQNMAHGDNDLYMSGLSAARFSHPPLFTGKYIGFEMRVIRAWWRYSLRVRRGGVLGSSTIFKNLMSPTPRRKWYLTTGRRAH